MPNIIHRLEEGTGEGRREKRKEKEQGNKCFADMAVTFPFQSGLVRQKLTGPELAVLVTSGQAQRTSHPTGLSPGCPREDLAVQ